MALSARDAGARPARGGRRGGARADRGGDRVRPGRGGLPAHGRGARRARRPPGAARAATSPPRRSCGPVHPEAAGAVAAHRDARARRRGRGARRRPHPAAGPGRPRGRPDGSRRARRPGRRRAAARDRPCPQRGRRPRPPRAALRRAYRSATRRRPAGRSSSSGSEPPRDSPRRRSAGTPEPWVERFRRLLPDRQVVVLGRAVRPARRPLRRDLGAEARQPRRACPISRRSSRSAPASIT